MTNTQQAAGSSAEASEWRKGGVTAVAAAIGYGAGPVIFLTTASLFIKPMMEATGWSTREVLISPWLSGLFALCGPLVSWMLDKRGVRVTAAFGLIAFTVLLVVFATMPLNRFTFYSVSALLGIFGSFAYAVTFNRAVAGWFRKGAGKAFGLVGAGGAVMPFLAIPLVSLAIYNAGWRTGYLVLGAFAIVLALPAVIFGIKQPPAMVELPNADAATEKATNSARRVYRSPRFWVLVAAVTISVGGANAFLANVQPILLGGGLSVVTATSITTLFSLGVITGRLGSGALLDLVSKYRVAMSVFIISAAGAIALTQASALPLIVVGAAALMVAFSQGAEGDIAAYFILSEYGRKNFAAIFALCFAVTAVGGIIIPFAFAWIVDTTGSYMGACYLGAGCYLAGALLLGLFKLMGPKAPATGPTDLLDAAPAESPAAVES
jgi:nitrate/nitrite transporter NarK